MTVFKPGQRPPHVTIAAVTSLGRKWRVARGPARARAYLRPSFALLSVRSVAHTSFLELKVSVSSFEIVLLLLLRAACVYPPHAVLFTSTRMSTITQSDSDTILL